MVTEVPTNLNTPEALIAFARTLPEVKRHLKDGKKIQAIKELRTKGSAACATGRVGLKEAKDACDVLAKETEYQPEGYYCCSGVNYHTTWCYNY
jgi:N-acetylglutamate synthase/N-acetylornithine aminotransferase